MGENKKMLLLNITIEHFAMIKLKSSLLNLLE